MASPQRFASMSQPSIKGFFGRISREQYLESIQETPEEEEARLARKAQRDQERAAAVAAAAAGPKPQKRPGRPKKKVVISLLEEPAPPAAAGDDEAGPSDNPQGGAKACTKRGPYTDWLVHFKEIDNAVRATRCGCACNMRMQHAQPMCHSACTNKPSHPLRLAGDLRGRTSWLL
jgi:hypothetical protein